MIAIIVLAAGQSRRMGTHKLVLPLAGRPVVAHVVDAAAASSLRPIVVVVGHGAEAVRHALAGRDIELVMNERFEAGLSTSLRAGLEALPDEVEGAIVTLGDQPGVTPQHFEALAALAMATAAAIVVPMYAGTRGNPVYFARSLFDELRHATGDSGGRQVIARHPELVRTLPIADLAAGDDLDTPEDYQRLLARWQADGAAGR